jgi:AcrR family transcriptional regulator
MSVGSNLQEMENVVTKGAAKAEPMPKLSTGIAPGQTGSWEDLGGPTPENYKTDDDSAKLKTPGATLAQVKNVVNKGAKSADPMQKLSSGAVKEESEEDEEDLISEEEILEATEDEDEGSDEDDAEDAKEGKKKKSKKEDDEDVKEEFDIEEDVNALLAGEELSEEFQEKARTIFEAAIKSKVAEIKEDLQAAYEEALVEEVQAVKSELVERVDAYLEYVADEWVAENALAIEAGLKTEMTESFLQGMRGLFEDHYVTIPEERYDVIESMVDKLDEMEEKLNEQIQRNVALNKRLAESVTDVIFAEVTEGLALSQKDKLASLAENVEFDSESSYREKLVTLRESYFPSNKSEASAQRNTIDNLAEEVDYVGQSTGVMSQYLQTLQRVSKK